MRKILLTLSFIGLLLAGYAQQALTGRVLSNKEPLAGANLRLLKAKKSTTADQEGRFTFSQVTLPDTLLISFMGFKAQLRAITSIQEPININMEPMAGELKEIIVNTGYQKLAAGRATGSYSLVDSSLFNRQIGTDVLRRLEGITPSLLYDKRGGEGGITRFSIRGLSTITGGATTQPLIILDNFPYEGDINQLNPNDVESITILKDAAAAAIWGTRAGNGVVVITTRSAKDKQPLNFSLVANTTVVEKPDLFRYPVMSSADFLSVEKYLYDRGFYNTALTNIRNRPVLSPYIELLEDQRLGRVSQNQVATQLGIWEQTDIRKDFNQYFQQLGIRQQYSLNYAAGTGQLSYVGSVGFDKNRSNLVGDEDQRLSIRNRFNLKPNKKLNLQAGILYTRTQAQNNALGSLNSLRPNGGKSNYYPYANLVDEQGNALALEQNYRKRYTDTTGRGLLQDWAYRPLDEIALANNRNQSQDILLDVQADYQLLPALKASVQYRFQNNTSQQNNNYSPESYFTRNLINRYSSISGNSITRRIPLGGIIDETNGQLLAHGLRGQLHFTKDWNMHQLELLAGAELRERENIATSNRSYGFDDLIFQSTPVDLVTAFPIYGLLAANSSIPNNNFQSSLLNRNVSYFFNASYHYTKRYSFSLSARRDASNIFGVNANQKGVPLGSVGAAWHVDQENFYNWSFMPRLNLRASYGYTGNVNNSSSALTTIRYEQLFLNINTFTGLPQATIVNPPNPDLRWETVGIFNIAADFETKNNRLRGNISYFHKQATDLIGLVAVDATTGGTGTRSLNSAALRNQGLELELQAQLIKRNDFQWQSNFLFSSSKNKVTKYLFEPTSPSFYVGNGGGVTPIVGKPAYGIVSYRWAGLDPANGDPQILVNGAISKDYTAIPNRVSFEDLIFHGPSLPVYFGALRQDFTYKQISLSVNMSYKLGYFYRRTGLSYSNLYNQWAASPEYALRWQQTGDEAFTQVPSIVYPANANRDLVYTQADVTVEPGDHIRLQDIRLAYQFKTNKLRALHLKHLSLFMYANNVGILWKASSYPFDPEYGDSFIPVRTLSFGLKTDF
jgi:TonB-linked SusC/RagA family outer membrane protein